MAILNDNNKKDKINVGFFIDSFFPMIDGVINVVDNLAKLLVDNCNVTVFTIKANKGKIDPLPHPYKVIKTSSIPIFFLDYNLPLPVIDFKFKKQLKNSNLDIVYFHSPMTIAKLAIKYAKKNNIPILCHLHSQYKQDFYRATKSKFLIKKLMSYIMKKYNQSDLAIAVNEFTKELFINDYGLNSPVKVVYNATDMKPLENKNKINKLINEKYNLKADEYVFCYVGRINKLKNIDLILNSLVLLKEKDFSNFKLLIVGNGNDLEYFKTQVKNLNLKENVVFTDSISDRNLLSAIYSRSNLLLFPSTYDTDGIVKFEAASQSTPCVCVENTGVASSITHLENGYISKNNAEDFANTIIKAMTNKEQYEKVCKNCFRDLYRTWQNSADEIYNIMLDLINQRRKNNEKNRI